MNDRSKPAPMPYYLLRLDYIPPGASERRYVDPCAEQSCFVSRDRAPQFATISEALLALQELCFHEGVISACLEIVRVDTAFTQGPSETVLSDDLCSPLGPDDYFVIVTKELWEAGRTIIARRADDLTKRLTGHGYYTLHNRIAPAGATTRANSGYGSVHEATQALAQAAWAYRIGFDRIATVRERPGKIVETTKDTIVR